jgi:hypothetical protein
MNHDQFPIQGDLTAELIRRVQEQRDSPYTRYAHDLLAIARDKCVRASQTGRSGYLLRFADGTWVVCFLAEVQLKWHAGAGNPADEFVALLDSHTGDGRSRLTIDRPYADEECDMAAEVAKAHGQPITGIAIGSNSFNLVFPKNRELDATIIPDRRGHMALRVFWEQW